MSPVGKSSLRSPAHPTNFLRAVLLLLLFFDVLALEHGEVCTNPDRERGTCIGIRNCPSLLSAIQAKPLPNATVDFLRRSQCGFQDRNPLVCCPSGGNQPTPVTGEATEDVGQHRNLGLLRTDICGPQFEIRIYLGTETLLLERPWVALLAYTVQNGSQFKCGGSIINERYVLTAASCVTDLPSDTRLVSVRLGEHNLTSPIDCEYDETYCAPTPQDITVEQVIPHPRYTGRSNLQHDLALVRLSRPANFSNEDVVPVCLPINHTQQTENLIGKRLILAGWGASMEDQPASVLRKLSMEVVPNLQCSRESERPVAISTANQICAQAEGDSAAPCPGDSGGSLTHLTSVKEGMRIVQHGIVTSGTDNCGFGDKPVVYTRVGHYMKWILDTIRP